MIAPDMIVAAKNQKSNSRLPEIKVIVRTKTTGVKNDNAGIHRKQKRR